MTLRSPIVSICWMVFVVLLAGPAANSLPAADAPANPDAEATTEAAMKPYTDAVSGTEIKFSLVPIPGGEFVMGSPEREPGRNVAEGPQRKVKIAPFWMGAREVTWDEYDVWGHNLDIKLRQLRKQAAAPRDNQADAVTRPTKPYTDMTFGMGHDGFPAICMTQLAAITYCEWLSAKTGHYYRLPTEAEWEYACRAGSKTAWSFGDDPKELGDYAWFAGNSDEAYHKVGQKKPNAWGLYDMHGNVMEWCLDQYHEDYFLKLPADQTAVRPVFFPTKLYPISARGGSWEDSPEDCRSARRVGSDPLWKVQDPQIPKSRWYLTDALFLGFRLVRPLIEPDAKEKEQIHGVLEKQDDV